MSEPTTSYEEFCQSLPESVRQDKEQLLRVCAAANVEVPLEERFYTKVHTPKKSRINPEPEPTNFVVVPNPRGGRRDLWVRHEDFADLLQAGIEFGTRAGLVRADSGDES